MTNIDGDLEYKYNLILKLYSDASNERKKLEEEIKELKLQIEELEKEIDRLNLLN